MRTASTLSHPPESRNTKNIMTFDYFASSSTKLLSLSSFVRAQTFSFTDVSSKSGRNSKCIKMNDNFCFLPHNSH